MGIGLMSIIYINSISNESYVNGPGKRCVIWLQGCSLKCAGCFNPSLHPFKKTRKYEATELAAYLSSLDCEGITISGGEPLDQSKALYELIMSFKSLCNKNILLFTGYTLEEIKISPQKIKTIMEADAVISGRYVEGEIWNNKRLILISHRISPKEIKAEENIEVSIMNNRALITGYPKNIKR